MSNKWYGEFSQRHGDTAAKPPSPSPGRGPTPTWSGADVPPYKAAGPGGPDMNTVGFPRVRVYMKSQMSPEDEGGGDIGKGVLRDLTLEGSKGFRKIGEFADYFLDKAKDLVGAKAKPAEKSYTVPVGYDPKAGKGMKR